VAPPRTLPDTGTDLTVALVGAACVAIGALATIVTRRRASTR
jgi:LPXTG-motif cell wall-anchored protein